MKYQEALKEFKIFLEKTEITKYCSEICKGGCCSQCHSLEDCDNRLSCKAFLCRQLIHLLLEDIHHKRYVYMMYTISNEIDDHINGNSYFTPYKSSMDNLDFDIFILSEIDTHVVYKKVQYLREIYNKRR